MYTGWWFGTFFIFPYIGNFIIPTDFHIFQRGRYTTNQILYKMYKFTTIYPLVNIQKTMENHHFSWEDSLIIIFIWWFSIVMLVYQRVVWIQTNKHHWGYVGPPHATGAGRSWWESHEKINRSSRGFSRCLGKAIYTLKLYGVYQFNGKIQCFFLGMIYLYDFVCLSIYIYIWTKGIHQFNPDDMWIIAQRGEPPFFFLTALFSFIYPVPTRVLGRPWSCDLDHSCLTVPPSRCHFHGLLLVDFFTHMFQFELKAAEKLWISSGLQANGSYQMCG